MSFLEEVARRRERLKRIVEERPYTTQIIQMEILYDMASMLSKMVVSLDEAAERLVRIENAIKAEQPEGFLGPVELTVTDKLDEYDPPESWFSMTIYNYGPNTVYIQVNDPTKTFVPLRDGESTSPDFKTAKIERIYFRCAAGESASIKIIGKR